MISFLETTSLPESTTAVETLQDSPGGKREAAEAFRRYNSISPELGARFRAELRVAVAFARRFPEAAVDLGEGTRRVLFRKPFLFALWYTIESGVVTVWAVAHQHQKPGYWTARQGGPA